MNGDTNAAVAVLEERIANLGGVIEARDERLIQRMEAGFKELSNGLMAVVARLDALTKSSGDGIAKLDARQTKTEGDVNKLGDSHRRLRARLVGDTPAEDGGLIASAAREHERFATELQELRQSYKKLREDHDTTRKIAVFLLSALLLAQQKAVDGIQFLVGLIGR